MGITNSKYIEEEKEKLNAKHNYNILLLETQISELRAELDVYTNKHDELTTSNDEIIMTNKSLHKEIDELKEQLSNKNNETNDELECQSEILESTMMKLNELEQNHIKCKEDNDKLNEEIKLKNIKNEELESKLDLILAEKIDLNETANILNEKNKENIQHIQLYNNEILQNKAKNTQLIKLVNEYSTKISTLQKILSIYKLELENNKGELVTEYMEQYNYTFLPDSIEINIANNFIDYIISKLKQN